MSAKLPVVDKNSKRIRHEGLDRQWIKTQFEDELKLCVYDPIEDGIAGAADSIIDPELLGLSALNQCEWLSKPSHRKHHAWEHVFHAGQTVRPH
jgi:hypothetical protein